MIPAELVKHLILCGSYDTAALFICPVWHGLSGAEYKIDSRGSLLSSRDGWDVQTHAPDCGFTPTRQNKVGRSLWVHSPMKDITSCSETFPARKIPPLLQMCL